MSQIAALYRQARTRVVALTADLSVEQQAQMVPATPLWNVREVVTHVAGVCADILNGRLDARGTEPWTQRQVEERADMAMAQLHAEWATSGQGLEQVFDKVGDERVNPRVLADVWCHEQDLRSVLQVPGGWDDGSAAYFVTRQREHYDELFIQHGVRIDVSHVGRLGTADGEPTLQIGASEFLRGVLGRRSKHQLLQWPWRGLADPWPLIEELLIFGIAEDDIIDAPHE